MPAKSRSQQRLMGMVHAEKKGTLNTKGMDPDLKKKVKKIASGIKSKDAEKFARTKHKGLPEVKENSKPTFKEFLIEITQQERKMLVPPPGVQRLYARIKQKHGIVKRQTFVNAMIDKFNLSAAGVKQLTSKYWFQGLRFDDDQPPKHQGAQRKDPWDHLKNKRSQRGSEAGANRALAGNRPLSQEKLDIIKRLGG